jgi:hypothetical protein
VAWTVVLNVRGFGLAVQVGTRVGPAGKMDLVDRAGNGDVDVTRSDVRLAGSDGLANRALGQALVVLRAWFSTWGAGWVGRSFVAFRVHGVVVRFPGSSRQPRVQTPPHGRRERLGTIAHKGQQIVLFSTLPSHHDSIAESHFSPRTLNRESQPTDQSPTVPYQTLIGAVKPYG